MISDWIFDDFQQFNWGFLSSNAEFVKQLHWKKKKKKTQVELKVFALMGHSK